MARFTPNCLFRTTSNFLPVIPLLPLALREKVPDRADEGVGPACDNLS